MDAFISALAVPPFPATPVVVIDCEFSGTLIKKACDSRKTMHGDVLFGFGLAVGYVDPVKREPRMVRQWSVGILPAGLDAPPATGAEWRKLWQKRGMEQDCFDFWSGHAAPDAPGLPGHLPALNALLTRDDKANNMVVSSYLSAASTLDMLLAGIEDVSPTGSYTLAVDTICTDAWLINMLLTQNGFFPLTHTRKGVYRRDTVDEDSALRISSALYPGTEATVALKKQLRDSAAAAAAPFGLTPHHPQCDAFMILHRVLAASVVLGAAPAKID